MLKYEKIQSNDQLFKPAYDFNRLEKQSTSEKVLNRKRLAVLDLDGPATRDFNETTQQYVESATIPCPTPSRVETSEEHGRNVITANPEGVSDGLAAGVERAIEQGHRVVTVACNTACLEDEFVDLTIKKLQAKGLYNGDDYILVTPLRAVRQKYHEENKRAPIFLGTNPISERLPKEQFDTLHNTGRPEVQELVQEIIWRVKATTGSTIDLDKIPKYSAGPLTDKKILDMQLLKLEQALIDAKIDEVTLGCTELPIGFKRLRELNPNMTIKTVDPAQIVAEKVRDYLNINPAKKPEPDIRRN
jgi:hypothetical protein